MQKMSFSLIIIISMITLAACSSRPTVTGTSATSDPSEEIKWMDEQVKIAYDNQSNVLAPSSFESTTTGLEKARQSYNRKDDRNYFFEQISLAKSYLEKTNAVTETCTKLLPGVVEQRKKALEAGVANYFPKEFASADNDLMAVTRQVENNDLSEARFKAGELENRYNNLELRSIKQAATGPARNELQMAINEGARDLAPHTLAWTEKRINDNENFIASDRYNKSEIQKAASDSMVAATRLGIMVRTAKNTQEKNLKLATVQSVSVQMAATRSAKSMEKPLSLESKYQTVKDQFSKDEAVIYKQKNKLVIHLKGMSFGNEDATISSDNYPLLSKVQRAIKEVNPAKVVIQGRADSRGDKKYNKELSRERAKAVMAYFLANEVVPQNKVQVEALGVSWPVASNKTLAGRAQNRTVDVILAPESK